MKEPFEEPIVEIIPLEGDVITTSTPGCNEGGQELQEDVVGP